MQADVGTEVGTEWMGVGSHRGPVGLAGRLVSRGFLDLAATLGSRTLVLARVVEDLIGRDGGDGGDAEGGAACV